MGRETWRGGGKGKGKEGTIWRRPRRWRRVVERARVQEGGGGWYGGGGLGVGLGVRGGVRESREGVGATPGEGMGPAPVVDPREREGGEGGEGGAGGCGQGEVRADIPQSVG